MDSSTYALLVSFFFTWTRAKAQRGQSPCCLLCIIAIFNYPVAKAIESLNLTFFLIAWLIINLVEALGVCLFPIRALKVWLERFGGLAGTSSGLAGTSRGLAGTSRV